MEQAPSCSFFRLSLAIQELSGVVKNRYLEKISVINSIDPYCARTNGVEIPTTVTTGHVVDYLLNHKSPFSGNLIQSEKSFHAYNKFESGFVTSVEGCCINNLYVVRGKVSFGFS